MRIKICGITQPNQAEAIAQLGASELGFICVQRSPRYVTPSRIQEMIAALPTPWVNRIGVFADATLAEIQAVVDLAPLSGIQLHGQESPAFCQALKAVLPSLEVIKAFRIQSPEQLAQVQAYEPVVDTFLLDAFHPQQLGGTGHTLDWQVLQSFQPQRPWFLAGGLKPENVALALRLIQPQGIDLSSGVESSPGHKDLSKVTALFEALRSLTHPVETAEEHHTRHINNLAR